MQIVHAKQKGVCGATAKFINCTLCKIYKENTNGINNPHNHREYDVKSLIEFWCSSNSLSFWDLW